MTQPRRKCRLSCNDYKDIDLTQYEDLIIKTINATVPNKNPKVFKTYFSTDLLTQSEAVKLGRALSKIEELNAYGKTVTTFRLFEGKTYDSEVSPLPRNYRKIKGGRPR